jgi:hypothetical protein
MTILHSSISTLWFHVTQLHSHTSWGNPSNWFWSL